MKEPRDFQRSKVYAWEKQSFGERAYREELSLEACREFGLRMMGTKRLRVKDGRGRSSAGALHQLDGRKTPTIILPKWARNEIVVCHEVAHLMTPDPSLAAHGAYFMKVYIDLLDKAGIYHADELIPSAKDFGLRVAS